MKRWFVGGSAVVGVVAAFALAVTVGMYVGGGAYASGTADRGVPNAVPAAVATMPGTAGPSPAPSPSPGPGELPGPLPTGSATEPVVALFVGDSYTAGQGVESRALRWSTLVARAMGWTELNVADGGTGFVSRFPGSNKLSYSEQMLSVRYPARIDVVVIAGGQNDFNELREDPGMVFEAVEDTYALAKELFPQAAILSVGPSTQRTVGLEARALDSAVRAAAERYDATYVSLLDPNVIRKRYIGEDKVHMNDEGYAAIAHRVLAQIS
ncbi:MAG TPA: SGNH/GDSL hydrolase family protein [Promicromonospora sp.]|nr:SGNH/GDSL hydrolase family protein [Promicromonospora sp.]